MPRPAAFAASLAVLLATAASADPPQPDPLHDGRAAAEAFLSGDTATLWARMMPEMQAAAGSEAALADLRDQIGGEETLLDETLLPSGDFHVYERVSRFGDISVNMSVVQDDAGRIAGFMVQPLPDPAPSAHLDYQTQAALRLPVEGRWFVFWGGREVAQNYHAADPGQRFAMDLLMLQDGDSHTGDPETLESYHCWDQPILAPSAGVVAAVVDGLPDQPIGESDPGNPAGNHVVIDFGNQEYGFLAHLRQGSVTVAEGQRVAAGDKVGRCGNSGNTSEPHLHFHLQTSAVLGQGEGLPAQFQNYRADGQPVSRGEPLRGQQIEPG